VHVRRAYDGNHTVRFVSEILEVMPPGDTERPSVNRLFLPDPVTGRARAAHTASPGLLSRLGAAGFDATLLDQHAARPGSPPGRPLEAVPLGSGQFGSGQLARRGLPESWFR
jgi:hypothetical protein